MTDYNEMIMIFLRGFLMGLCDIMPGISGGTVALITGIYEKLISSISNIKLGFLRPLFRADLHGFYEQLLDEVDFAFFVPLLVGILLAFLLMSNIINFLLNDYAGFTYSFFGGLILASIVVLYRQLDAFNLKAILTTIIFMILAYLFIGMNPIEANHSVIVLFISGFITICAMLLPGVSGSSLLLILGQYEFIIDAIDNLDIIPLLVFVIGAIVGLMGMSRIIRYLLMNYKQVTVAALIGIMLGSLRIPLEKVISVPSGDIPLCLILAIVGIVLVLGIEYRSQYELI